MSPLGKSHALLDEAPLLQRYRRIFGIEDYHSHFRWNAIKRYLDPSAKRILEVGAHSGLMTFEIVKHNPDAVIVASEFDAEKLADAQTIRKALGANSVELSQADLRELSVDAASFDQALLIDVLEHIDDQQTAVAHLAAAIKPGGSLVVSVPTPNYPVVFGRAFHESIGHVREGYWLEDLQDVLEPAGFKIEAHHYYTGPIASRGCSMYYRREPGMKFRWRMLSTPPMLAAGLLGERNVTRDRAASIALLARRV